MDAVHVTSGVVDFVRRQIVGLPDGAGWHLAPTDTVFAGYSYQNGQFSPPAPKLTLAERRDVLMPHLSQKRYEVETGGVAVMGINVRTDEVGQSKLTGAMVAMDNDPSLVSIDWEAQPGVWVTLDQPTISGLSYVVARHVQACFSRARVVSEAIMSASTHAAMDTAEAEIALGWPV